MLLPQEEQGDGGKDTLEIIQQGMLGSSNDWFGNTATAGHRSGIIWCSAICVVQFGVRCDLSHQLTANRILEAAAR